MTIRCLLLLLVFSCSGALAQKKSPLLGKWENPNGDGRIEFKKRGDTYYGILYWIKQPNHPDGTPKLDLNNPKPELRTRRIQGIELMFGLVDKGNGVFEDGFVYEPKSATNFNCRLTLDGDQLQMQGYLGTPLLGRTEIWKRIKK